MFKELTDLYNKKYEYNEKVDEMCRNAYAIAFDVNDYDDMWDDTLSPTDYGMLNWEELTISTSYSPPVTFAVGSNGNDTFVHISSSDAGDYLSLTEKEFMDPQAFAEKIKELAKQCQTPSACIR